MILDNLFTKELLSVPRWFIFWPYIVIPISLFLIFCDYFFFNGAIKKINLLTLLPFLLIFNLPHILQSFYPFTRKEYRERYLKKNILIFLGTLLVTLLLVTKLSFLYVIFFSAITGYHIARQQIGQLFLTFTTPVSKEIRYWGNFFVLCLVTIYTSVELNQINHFLLYTSARIFLSLLVLSFIIHSWYTYKKIEQTSLGEKTYGLTVASLILTYFLFRFGYGLLAFFIIRFIHDFTAFTFYALRDLALHHMKINFLNCLKVTIYPLSAILISFFILKNYYTEGAFLLTLLALYHYFTESYTWKRDSLNTRYLKKTIS